MRRLNIPKLEELEDLAYGIGDDPVYPGSPHYRGWVPFTLTIPDNDTSEQDLTSAAALAVAEPLVERFLEGDTSSDKEIVARVTHARCEVDLAVADQTPEVLGALRASMCLRSTIGGSPQTVPCGLGLITPGRVVPDAGATGTSQVASLEAGPDWGHRLSEDVVADFRATFAAFWSRAVDMSAAGSATLWLYGSWHSRERGGQVKSGCSGAKRVSTTAEALAKRALRRDF